MLPSPATCQPLLLVPDPRAVCLRLLTFPVTMRSPLYQPWHAPSYMLAPEGFDRCRSLRISISLPPSPQFILCILASCGSWYPCQVVFSREGERPWSLHYLEVAQPGTHSSPYLAIPAPFRLPGSPTPFHISPSTPCHTDPIPVGRRSMGSSARNQCKGILY